MRRLWPSEPSRPTTRSGCTN